MWGFGGRKWRIAAVTYPALQAIVVLATANHFLLDVLGGATCILLGYGIVTVIGRVVGRSGSRGTAARTAELEAATVSMTPVAAVGSPAMASRSSATETDQVPVARRERV